MSINFECVLLEISQNTFLNGRIQSEVFSEDFGKYLTLKFEIV